MVSIRCKMIVKSELSRLGLKYGEVNLGQVDLITPITEEQRLLLKARLLRTGLELMEDKRIILVERIKNIVVEMIHYSDEVPKTNFSDFLSDSLDYNYTYLADLFSEVTGMNIEHYIIINKIERVKELIIYNELSLTEISYKMNYSSVAYLSNQFKKITGLTPSFYKNLKEKRRSFLEDM